VGKVAKTLVAVAIVLAGIPLLVGGASANPADEQGFVDRLNALRTSRGLAPLVVDARLRDVARNWSSAMATVNVMSHNPLLSTQVPSGWRALGENVGYGPGVQSIHDALVASPPHFANMTDGKFNTVGIGVVWSGPKLWVTQVFMQAPATFVPATVVTSGSDWYRMAGTGGQTYSFGAAVALPGVGTRSPVVAAASTATGSGTWLAAADGSVLTQGDAGFFGSMGGKGLAQPVVGMAATPTGKGYWLVAPDGGIFAFGDAAFFGSTGATRLNQPVVGMASTKAGKGYWLVARDGGIFAFGDAVFHGSTGAMKLNQPIVGMARSASGKGYRFVAADGGIFSFGDAAFLGSAGGGALPSPVTALVAAAA